MLKSEHPDVKQESSPVHWALATLKTMKLINMKQTGIYNLNPLHYILALGCVELVDFSRAKQLNMSKSFDSIGHLDAPKPATFFRIQTSNIFCWFPHHQALGPRHQNQIAHMDYCYTKISRKHYLKNLIWFQLPILSIFLIDNILHHLQDVWKSSNLGMNHPIYSATKHNCFVGSSPSTTSDNSTLHPRKLSSKPLFLGSTGKFSRV